MKTLKEILDIVLKIILTTIGLFKLKYVIIGILKKELYFRINYTWTTLTFSSNPEYFLFWIFLYLIIGIATLS